MKCPKCGATQLGDKKGVLETRHGERSIRRRRLCKNCGKRFTTREYTCQDLEDLILLRNRYLPNLEKDGLDLAICMTEDIRTALDNATRLERLLTKQKNNLKKLLSAVNEK